MRGAAAIVAALFMLAGCGSGTPEVPDIENPREARAADPCALMDAGALAAAGLSGPGTPVAAAEGPRCEWRGASPRMLAITLFTGAGGLATLAENSAPTTTRVRLAGYPALETFTGEGEFCQYDVGTAQDQVVLVALDGGVPDSCTELQELVPDILGRLPAAGR
ncbi:DUF3558 family protein [Pseudonocardia saturnea]